MSQRRFAVAGMFGACLLAACATTPPRKPAALPGSGAVAQSAPAAAETTPALPAPPPATAGTSATADATGVSASGLDIYRSFRAGLAEPECDNAQPRWQRHFANAPARLGEPDGDTLALFGYVVASLREAGLPTEFALIPFVESGYSPGARSKAGPAGLWQFIGATARHHGVRIAGGYDGRLSPVESTRAAVRYLGHLHQRFDGDWRLTLMAYNAGEFRVLRALQRSGGVAVDAGPAGVPGLAPLTYAYVDKLHALACLLEDAGEQPQWRERLDRPVVPLREQPLEGARSLDAWAAAHGQDAATLRRLNPALAGRWPAGHAPVALVPDPAGRGDTARAPARRTDPAGLDGAATYTVRRGDSAWSIARSHGVSTKRLLELNNLRADSVLRPGMVLKVQ